MTQYQANAMYYIPDGRFITVEADDLDDAEFRMLEDIREYEPDAIMIELNNLKEAK